jgi:hypothetical protein
MSYRGNCSLQEAAKTLSIYDGYLVERRKELYMRPLFSKLIPLIQEDIGTQSLNYGEYFVTDVYNLPVLESILKSVLRSVDKEIPEKTNDTENYIGDLLVHVWPALPLFLKKFSCVYGNCDRLDLLHQLIVKSRYSPTVDMIRNASHLPAGYYLYYGFGLVMKGKIENCMEFMSNITTSKSTMRLIMDVIVGSQLVTIPDHLKNIHENMENKGLRYYNVSTGSFIYKKTLKNFKYVNDTRLLPLMTTRSCLRICLLC